jgi:glyoxylase I family protein
MKLEDGNAGGEVCGLHHIAVQTRDLDASLRLYRDVLGMEVVMEVEPVGGKIILLDMGDGGCIELFAPRADSAAPDSPGANSPLMHIALTTSDTRGVLERVRRAGYEVTREVTESGLGDLKATIAFFKGPDGEVLELWQPR